MAPTYMNWQIFISDRRLPDLKRGDVVVVRTDEGVLLKRIAYAPGDSYLRWNGVNESWDMVQVTPSQSVVMPQCKVITVPQDHYYVIGDNLAESRDSRQFGPVTRDQIISWLPDAPPPSMGTITVNPLSRSQLAAYGVRMGKEHVRNAFMLREEK